MDKWKTSKRPSETKISDGLSIEPGWIWEANREDLNVFRKIKTLLKQVGG
ncbi:hypothetical protein NEISUBOT_04704 [Neisseria subflava NJ9703]|uniref:Uncharacterized protein n=1 Tax=Neisseria subflava NJ9703 TaxID=546268 RepID=A0A9W5MZ70_NEISU|nr:hypothetical protein NEISUBOT_04704 [Neisseria subflava NJ9703]